MENINKTFRAGLSHGIVQGLALFKNMAWSKKIYTIIIIALISLITYLHYSSAPEFHALHDIYREFYYLPVLIGAFIFGIKGAVFTFLLVVALYLPYVFTTWTGAFISEANKLLHIFLQGFFAFFAGFLIERDRQHRAQMEKERYLAGIGKVAATIAHDLRNPLITILGFSKRLEEGKGERENTLRAIRDSALTMQNIVHDVLDFSKPIHLKLTGEDLRDTVRRACDSCKARAKDEGVALTVELTPEPLPAEVDASHLERAIINLINNAIDASAKGQNVVVRAAPGKGYLTISIRDSGAGMDKETLDNIFIPFFTKKSSGTGLGMPIAQKIVEGHRGRIHISSKPGQGTEIKVELPGPPKKEG